MDAADLFDELACAGFTLRIREGRLLVSPASALTDAQRQTIRVHREKLVEALTQQRPLLPEPWSEAEIEAFAAHYVRLAARGLPDGQAEILAERLMKRDRDREHDERVSCVQCKHYRPGRCGNHRRAELNAADVGREFAAMLQRCPGFHPAR